jgi:hypothetical protein
MPDTASAILTPWSNFYVIAGSSAGALTGLMFVVITLIADRRAQSTMRNGVSTYSTPTVVHFCTALFVAAILTAPWPSLVPLGIVLAIIGIYGIFYVLYLTHLARRLDDYTPDMEDWIWYTSLPLLSYVAIAAAAFLFFFAPRGALFALAAAVLLLIFIGIHNAWDIVTFITIDPRGKALASGDEGAAPASPDVREETAAKRG